MGCVRDTDRRSQEEFLLCGNERLLGFNNCTAEEADMIVRKYCSSPLVPDALFQIVCQKLGINTKEIPACKMIPDYYKGVKGKNGLSKIRLLVLAIMLAEGTTWAKLDLLFEAADLKGDEQASSDRLANVFVEMLDVATDLTRKLVSQHQITQVPSILAYFKLLSEGRSNAQQYLQARLLKKNMLIEKSKFMARVRRAGIDNIAECSGLRALVLRLPTYQPRIRTSTVTALEAVPEEQAADSEVE